MYVLSPAPCTLERPLHGGPFIRPEGSPFFAAYNDPTVWRLMQQTLRAAEVEQVLPAQAGALR
jgi:hypothetical protein